MEKLNTPYYSVIIPVYNTNSVLVELSQRIEEVFVDLNRSFEIIMVDDGSSNPATWPRIKELVENHEEIRGIQLTKNHGQHNALICGMSYARGEYLITMDDDLQQAPEDISLLIGAGHHDVVIGQFRQKKHSAFRNFGSSVKGYVDRIIFGIPRGIRASSFCLIQRNVAEKMLAKANAPMPLFSSLLFTATRDVVGVEVGHSVRKEGKSGYTLITLTQMFARTFNTAAPHSTKPKAPFSVLREIEKYQN